MRQRAQACFLPKVFEGDLIPLALLRLLKNDLYHAPVISELRSHHVDVVLVAVVGERILDGGHEFVGAAQRLPGRHVELQPQIEEVTLLLVRLHHSVDGNGHRAECNED